MEQLENKTIWTLEETRSYLGRKNILATRRLMHRLGVAIRHGMVNRNELFNCLSGTANVPPVSLYRCIKKTNETKKRRYNHGHNTDDIWNHQGGLRTAQPDLGSRTAGATGHGPARQDNAAGVGRPDCGSYLPQRERDAGLVCAV